MRARRTAAAWRRTHSLSSRLTAKWRETKQVTTSVFAFIRRCSLYFVSDLQNPLILSLCLFDITDVVFSFHLCPSLINFKLLGLDLSLFQFRSFLSSFISISIVTKAHIFSECCNRVLNKSRLFIFQTTVNRFSFRERVTSVTHRLRIKMLINFVLLW